MKSNTRITTLYNHIEKMDTRLITGLSPVPKTKIAVKPKLELPIKPKHEEPFQPRLNRVKSQYETKVPSHFDTTIDSYQTLNQQLKQENQRLVGQIRKIKQNQNKLCDVVKELLSELQQLKSEENGLGHEKTYLQTTFSVDDSPMVYLKEPALRNKTKKSGNKLYYNIQ